MTFIWDDNIIFFSEYNVLHTVKQCTDLNKQDEFGRTPFHWICYNATPNIIIYAIESGGGDFDISTYRICFTITTREGRFSSGIKKMKAWDFILKRNPQATPSDFLKYVLNKANFDRNYLLELITDSNTEKFYINPCITQLGKTVEKEAFIEYLNKKPIRKYKDNYTEHKIMNNLIKLLN